MIVLDILQLREWRPLSRTTRLDLLLATLDPVALQDLEAAFARWLLELLRYQVRQAIKRQIFPRVYEPLSDSWVEQKRHQGLKPGFWIATGQLESTIKVWLSPETGRWTIGWPEGVRHKANPKVDCADIAKWMERGTVKMPARPLFVPLAESIGKSIVPRFTTFCVKHYPDYATTLKGDGSEPPKEWTPGLEF